jgi:hypothetical protein
MSNFWIGVVLGWGIGGVANFIMFALVAANHYGDEDL